MAPRARAMRMAGRAKAAEYPISTFITGVRTEDDRLPALIEK